MLLNFSISILQRAGWLVKTKWKIGELQSEHGKNQKIKIKVKDGDIVFPVEAKGKTAIVEGTVYKIDLTKEEALNYYEHVAEEQGVAFDPSTVTGPVTIYQIKGLGAEIN